MVEVTLRHRKSPVLTPSSLPCLKNVATLNVTEGCALGCKYCYIQGYSQYPGRDHVVVYENLPELVATELKRRRRKPPRVYFCPSSDAFQYLPQVRQVSLRTMKILLESGVEVAFLTKGFITRPFIDLFSKHANTVFAQIGITTLTKTIWKAIEPRTAPPGMRINTIKHLTKLGIRVTARLDPLIPDVTDTNDNLLPLFEALAAAGVHDVAASYLFTRSPLVKQVNSALSPFVGKENPCSTWTTQTFADNTGRGRMIDLTDRKRRFAHLQELGNQAGVSIQPCRCKNPELAIKSCEIAGPITPATNAHCNQNEFAFLSDD